MVCKTFRRSFGHVFAALCLFSYVPVSGFSAELQLRKALLVSLRNRVTASVTAVVDHIGNQAHPLSEDCDLHVPLRSQEIRVPFIGEVKNACSDKPAGTGLAHWSKRIYEETHGAAVQVTGAFRIWLEHPPPGNAAQTEASPVPWYKDSNPDHQIELHPLTGVGTLDFTGHVKRIKDGSQVFQGVFGASKLPSVLAKKITVQEIEAQGEPYIRIQGTKACCNHWNLKGRVVQGPQALVDGTAIRVDVLQGSTGSTVVPGASGIPLVAVQGTAAHQKLQTLGVGDVIEFQAVVRMHLSTILDQAGRVAKQIPLPLEFILLDVQ